MKIGILTMHRISNYGSFIQALGLKQLIHEIGYDAEFVDFEVGLPLSEEHWKDKWPLYQIRNWRFRFLMRKPKIVVNERAEDICIRSENALLGITDEMKYRTPVDVLIIGSDEVFNYIQTTPVGYSPELLGKNNNARSLNSYAASCGNLSFESLEKNHKSKEMAKLLCRFDSISVRDKNSYNVVNQLTGIEPEYHLDPVLVADYSMLFRDNATIENYVLLYGYENRFSDKEIITIRQYAASRNKRLITLGGRQKGVEDHVVCSPLDVVSWFRNADSVITDTFHGTIFSCIAHTRFLVISRPNRGYGYGNENKINDLLDRLQIQDRRLNKLQEVQDIEKRMQLPIDFMRIDALRKKEKERSIDYLSKICIEK